MADDVTRTMSKGGVLVKNPVSAPGPPPFKNPGSAPDVDCDVSHVCAVWLSSVRRIYYAHLRRSILVNPFCIINRHKNTSISV